MLFEILETEGVAAKSSGSWFSGFSSAVMAPIAFSTSLETFHLAEAISLSYFDRLLVEAPPSQFKYQLLNSKQSILCSDGWISVAEKSCDNEKDEQLLKSDGSYMYVICLLVDHF